MLPSLLAIRKSPRSAPPSSSPSHFSCLFTKRSLVDKFCLRARTCTYTQTCVICTVRFENMPVVLFFFSFLLEGNVRGINCTRRIHAVASRLFQPHGRNVAVKITSKLDFCLRHERDCAIVAIQSWNCGADYRKGTKLSDQPDARYKKQHIQDIAIW